MMNVVFGEPDKMFRLIGEALAPSETGDAFLRSFFLTESADPVALLRRWSERRGVPPGIGVTFCETKDEFRQALRQAEAAVVEKQAVTPEMLEEAARLKLVQVFGLDTSRINADACAQHGVTVRDLVRHSNCLVSEHVVMLALALTRGLDASRAAMAVASPLPASDWAFNWPACGTVRGLRGRTVGLLGLGEVGGLVARYLRPFGADIIYSKRSRDPVAERDLGIRYVGMDELLATADVLSIHVPGGPQTHHLIDAAALAKAKPGSFIVNTARGSIIDEEALVAALRSGRVGGAALDVFSVEPLVLDHPLRSLPNVILTPHLAAGTRDEAWLDDEIGPVVDAVLKAGRA